MCRKTSVLSMLVIGLLMSGDVLGQDGPRDSSEQQGGEREGRRGGFGRGDGEGRRGPGRSRRGFGRGPRTPEERNEMYGRMVDRYLDRFEEDYALTDEQSAEVKSELEKVKQEHAAYFESVQEEHDGLMEEMRGLIDKSREGEDFDRDRMREIGRRLHEIRSSSPMLSFDRVRVRMEELLPYDRVESGRERQAERRRRIQRFWERRMVEDRLDGRERFRGFGPGGGDPWERYVNGFIDVYDLDESQEVTAKALLRDYVGRREAYQAGKKDAFAEAEKIEDRRERRERERELNAPVDDLFEELKTRLDQIPTAAQKMLVEQERSARTQPAGEGSATTRPAGRRPNRQGDYRRRAEFRQREAEQNEAERNR